MGFPLGKRYVANYRQQDNMSDYKLVYYGVRGRAEPMRLSFVAAGKKFEDVKIGMEPDSPDKESEFFFNTSL